LQVKLRTQIATEQERLLKEKDQELESLRQDLATTKDSLKEKTDQVYSNVIMLKNMGICIVPTRPFRVL
jgi:hypothetical protein